MCTPKRSTLLRYLQYAKAYKWLIALTIFAGLVKFCLPLFPAWVYKVITDQVLYNKEQLSDEARKNILWWAGGGLVVFAILESISIYFRAYLTAIVSSSMAFDLRQDLWKHLQRLDLGFHRSRPSGSLMSRLMSDISVSQQMINGGIVNVVMDAIGATSAFAVLAAINWKLALMTISVLPFYFVLYMKLNPRLREISESVQEQQSMMSGVAVERLSGIAVVQSFAQEPAETKMFAAYADELRGLNVLRSKLNEQLSSVSNFLVTMATNIIWIVGAYMNIGGGLTTGEIVQFMVTVNLLYLPVRRFSEINFVYQTSMNAIDRIFALFDVAPEVLDKPGVPDRTPGLGGIEFQKVCFQYRDEGPHVLHDVSFRVSPGERVAIVGESGAGKSTLVTLIPRLYDVTEGGICIDGVDVRDYPLRKLRRSIGIVLQDTILFSGTVRENLRYGRKKATDQEILDAAKAANAHEFIEELPQKYDTIIGERGMGLSGGQRQRISLARTILHNPRILILDEATSSLDSESENLITEAMHRVMAGRTCVIIAHRLSTIVGADRILVFREGRLVEEGPHTELLAAGGYYTYLFDQQFGPLQELLGPDHDKNGK